MLNKSFCVMVKGDCLAVTTVLRGCHNKDTKKYSPEMYSYIHTQYFQTAVRHLKALSLRAGLVLDL